MTCSNSDAPDPRALAALAAVGLLLADRFPEAAVPSLRRVAGGEEAEPKKPAPKKEPKK